MHRDGHLLAASYASANLPAGVDSLSLDNRHFNPCKDDMAAICTFFSIGKLIHYEKEKGVVVSHSNHFVFLKTNRGVYALKFYPPETARTLMIEYAISCALVRQHFPAPAMLTGHDGRPFWAGSGWLVACYDYLDGPVAWQLVKDEKLFPRINASMLALNKALAGLEGRIPFLPQEDLVATAKSLAQDSHSLASYGQKKVMDNALQGALQTYLSHPGLFTRKAIHNNVTLTNILVHRRKVHVLDLSHIRMDHVLSDLAGLVISLLFFDVPLLQIKTIVKNHFKQHGTSPEYTMALNSLVQIRLTKEYLKNIRRERSVGKPGAGKKLVRTWLIHLASRQKAISNVLKKINSDPRLIV